MSKHLQTATIGKHPTQVGRGQQSAEFRSHLVDPGDRFAGRFASQIPSVFMFALVLIAASASGTDADSAIDFQKHVAPILATHCIRCHDAGNSEGDLSLESMDDLRAREFIIPGDPDASHLIEIVSPDGDEPPVMPKEGQPLTAQQLDVLRAWIQQGADWPRDAIVRQSSKADGSWWAYQPLRVVDPPELSNASTDTTGESVIHPIDRFIVARLWSERLRPAAQADRRTLARRLSFDLHGLPPAPQMVDAFISDDDPRAYEKLVDRLLESPQYGERYARHWLDIAHYADTHGFERDKRRDNAWRYRDYVIDAFNGDKPYDRFLQEQIAGDVLWPSDQQAIIATGFLAAGPWDFVGHVETKSPILRRSARALDLDDMATQVMTATMGMTVNCARCHNHKLDPISQQEYYQLQAVFAGLRRQDRVVSEAVQTRYDKRREELITARNKLDFEIAALQGQGFDLADIVGGGNGLGTGTYRNAIDPRNAKVQTRNFGNLGNVVTNQFTASAFPFVDGVFIPDGENGKAEIPITSSGIKISGLPTTSGKAWDMIRNGPVASQHSPALDGIDFTKDGHHLLGLHANAGITFNVAKIRSSLFDPDPSRSETTDRSLRFVAKVGYFGAVGNNYADAWVLVDGNQVAEFRRLGRSDGLQDIQIDLPTGAQFLTLISTDGGNGYGMDQICFADPKIKRTRLPTLSETQRQRLTELSQKRKHILRQLDRLGPPPRFYGVTPDQSVPQVRVLLRGNPESPQGDPVSPGGPAALAMLEPAMGSLQSDSASRRAALARWITHPDNPLVRRVIANRLWQWHFGTGLVDTPSDFGFGGGRPSHPELLDWLAQQVSEQNWSLKAMHRLILTSATYKQVSYADGELGSPDATARGGSSPSQIDADNRLLWRQNPRRIEAEAIRDSVLFVSGKLNPAHGGPGFEDFTYQDAYAPIYTYVTADDPSVWRRSIYRYVVRTTPNRFLTTLDCPDPANLTPKRLTTTTPLQSLALYNNEFMLKQSRYFAARVEREVGKDHSAQASRAFTLAFARQPTAFELRLATDLITRQSLLVLCRSLFNSNEFLYVD